MAVHFASGVLATLLKCEILHDQYDCIIVYIHTVV